MPFTALLFLLISLHGELKMKIVIITGASTGIGKAAALRLAAKGLHVLAGVRRDSDAKTWMGIPNAQPLLIDVTDEASITNALNGIRKLLDKAKEIHLVNNAGIAVAGPIEGVPISRWREQFDVNVFGLVRATQIFLPYIRATRGRIVNVSSVAGLAASPYMGPYSASKFAVEAISDALRRELRQFGCKVVVVEPGPVATPIWEKSLGKKEVLQLPAHLNEIYGRELKKFQRGVEGAVRNAVSVDRVSDAIEKALFSAKPRTRYIVGEKALQAQMAINGFLPDSWVDAMIARQFSN